MTIGLLMIISGARDTYDAFGKQLVGDFTGSGNFTYWLVALGFVGALGYIKQFQAFSRLFMVLVIVAMVIRNGGVFDKLTQALAAGPVHPGDNAIDVTGAKSGTGSADNPISRALNSFDPTKYSGSTAATENFKTAVNAVEAAAPFIF